MANAGTATDIDLSGTVRIEYEPATDTATLFVAEVQIAVVDNCQINMGSNQFGHMMSNKYRPYQWVGAVLDALRLYGAPD